MSTAASSQPARRSVTGLLRAWSAGDDTALAELIPLVHAELRHVARRLMRGERDGHTLQTTALVNEAYVRLVDLTQVRWQDRAHFFAMSARLMRRILVDHARSRTYLKRGGRSHRISLDDDMLAVDRGADLVALDDALAALAAIDARKSEVVELRFFGGLTVEETALALRVSSETVLRDWRFAKTWLLRELTRKP
jgi:RNA polymerase sigma-70 factor (ECF subfamily)